ncbi:MAG: YaiI/YqxD family protein [Spirochaetae bacterium HGW-Spirochaetae-3]|jgi:hypothetical protein|nr:MAG: YaiI/YqxD family protein [Spirochaetae bacterium HGW-Spirochaetae-3]
MTLWADADSLPREVKELIGRRAGSSNGGFPIRAVFVANRPVPLPPGKNLQAVIVGPAGASARTAPDGAKQAAWDNADDYIIASAVPGDVLITRDIPLAARAIDHGLVALNDRGALWTADTVRERLSLRDHMAALRELGTAPPLAKGRGFGPKDVKAFADALDKAIRAALTAQRT